jgi:hypothetical protein
MKRKNAICYFCGKRKICIIEDVGGQIYSDNSVPVCLNCAIKDRIRRYKERELTKKEFSAEIKEIKESK